VSNSNRESTLQLLHQTPEIEVTQSKPTKESIERDDGKPSDQMEVDTPDCEPLVANLIEDEWDSSEEEEEDFPICNQDNMQQNEKETSDHSKEGGKPDNQPEVNLAMSYDNLESSGGGGGPVSVAVQFDEPDHQSSTSDAHQAGINILPFHTIFGEVLEVTDGAGGDGTAPTDGKH